MKSRVSCALVDLTERTAELFRFRFLCLGKCTSGAEIPERPPHVQAMGENVQSVFANPHFLD